MWDDIVCQERTKGERGLRDRRIQKEEGEG
jgi:hypothetical protein